MAEIEKVIGKKAGDMNRTYGALQDARKYLKNVANRFEKQVTPTFLQRLIEKIPIIKGFLTGSPDQVIGTRSGQLIDILKTRTKEIEKLAEKTLKLEAKKSAKRMKEKQLF